MDIKQLKEQMQAALLAARGICDEAEQKAREFTADERVKLEGYLKEAGDLKAQIKQAEGDADLRKQIMDLGGLGLATPRDGQMGVQPGRGQSLGERFVNAKAFQDWMKAVAPGGRIPEGARGLMSPPVEFESLLARKALITGGSDTSAGAFVETDYTGIYEPLGRRELSLLDLIQRRTTDSDLVSFVRETAKITQATPVAEANVTTYSGSTGEVSGEKPEGTMTFTPVTEAVKTLAVWVPATKRALSDAAQLRGIIDGELREDVMEELEDQVADGNGSGENFTGILNTPNVLEQAWDTDLFTTTRKAKTYVRTTGRSMPNAWVLNPEDWEAIELTKDGENRYYYGGPLVSGPKPLWGIPVVESEAIPQGTGLLGDFRKAIIWDRQRTTIQISDSHEDFFIRNMIAILAEMRAAFGVIRPSAFCLVALESGS